MNSIVAVIGKDQSTVREELWRSLHAVWPELNGRAEVTASVDSSDALGRMSPTVWFLDPELLKPFFKPATRYLQWLTVPHAAELRVVAVSDIQYLQADNKYTTLVTRSSTFLLNLSLKEMQRKLDPEVFWRIHRGTIVNVSAIDTIYRSFRGSMEIKLKDRNELLPVSATHAYHFKHL